MVVDEDESSSRKWQQVFREHQQGYYTQGVYITSYNIINAKREGDGIREHRSARNGRIRWAFNYIGIVGGIAK